MVLVTLLLMLVTSNVFMHGYRETKNGRSEMRPLAEMIWQKYPDAEVYTSLPFGERASVDLSIYDNRPTGWITLAEMARPSAHARVVIMRRREREPDPSLPGWKWLMTLSNGVDAWFAFAQDAKPTEK